MNSYFEIAVSLDWTDGECGRVMAALRHGVGDVTGSTCSPKHHCEGQAHSGEVGRGVFVSRAFRAGLGGSQHLGSLRMWLCGGGINEALSVLAFPKFRGGAGTRLQEPGRLGASFHPTL